MNKETKSPPGCDRVEAIETLSENARSGISPKTNEKPTLSMHSRDYKLILAYAL